MIKRLWNYKWYIIIIICLIFAEPSLASWLMLWIQRIYNSVTIGTPRHLIIGSLMVGVFVWVGRRLLLYAIGLIKSRFICNIKQDLKHDIFINVFNLKTSSIFQIAATGEYLSFLTNDITIIEQRFFLKVISLFSNIVRLIILGSTFFTMNLKLATFVFVFGIVVMFIPSYFSKKLNSANLMYSDNLSKFTQKIKEFLAGYSTIKNYAIEKVVFKKFNQYNEMVEDSKFDYDCELSIADSIGTLLTWFSRVLVIGAGLVMMSKGEILIGTIIAAQGFTEELATPMQGIVEDANSIKSVKAIIKKIEKATSESSAEKKAPLEINDAEKMTIAFKHLSVPINNQYIVKDFSYTFEANKKYLIIGKNGSGKSSLFKALKKGFLNYQGEIFINGTDVRNISNEALSREVSYLNENVALFSGSLKDNVTFWDHYCVINFQEILDNAHVELSSDRMIGENGFDISSGEQRRIEIARSTLSPAKVLVFDEVVSTLDIETAYEIEREVLEYRNKTVIFISHNFSGKLLPKYDAILVMKNGCLVASGTYQELLDTSEYFRKICEIKFG